jgi:hypothetical protein
MVEPPKNIEFLVQLIAMRNNIVSATHGPASAVQRLRSPSRSLRPAQGRIGASHASAASNWSINSRRTFPSECSCLIAVKAWKRTKSQESAPWSRKQILTTSQNRKPLSTSCFGSFTPGKVSSQISSAMAFASFTPSALGSRTRVPLLI